METTSYTSSPQTGYILTETTPTLKLEDLQIGQDYLLPADNSKLISRTLLEIKAGGICKVVSAHKTSNSIGTYHTYFVHYSWLRSMDHKPRVRFTN